MMGYLSRSVSIAHARKYVVRIAVSITHTFVCDYELNAKTPSHHKLQKNYHKSEPRKYIFSVGGGLGRGTPRPASISPSGTIQPLCPTRILKYGQN